VSDPLRTSRRAQGHALGACCAVSVTSAWIDAAASSTSAMFSMNVTSPSRPLHGAYRTDPATSSRLDGAHDSITLPGVPDTIRQLQLDFYRDGATSVTIHGRVAQTFVPPSVLPSLRASSLMSASSMSAAAPDW